MPDLPQTPVVDHRPVRPLNSKRTAACSTAVMSLSSLAFLRLLLPFRQDLAQLGTLEAFALSAVELTIAGLLMWIGLRQLIPGRLLPPVLLAAAAAAATGCGILVGVRSALRSPTTPAIGEEFQIAALCMAVIAALSALFVPFAWRFLETRATPRRRATVLSLGLAAGLAANAVWRLFCPYSETGHQVLGHGGGLCLVILLSVGFLAISDHRHHR